MKKLIFLLMIFFISFSMYAQPTRYGTGAGTGGDWTDSYYGRDAGKVNTGTFNTFLGARSGEKNTSGSSNTFTGAYTGLMNTTGNFNSFFGTSAGTFNTTGHSNTFSGYQTGYNNTTGFANTFTGVTAGFNNTTGKYNSFYGNDAGRNNASGYHNSFIGYRAGNKNTSGRFNTFLGSHAGYSNTTGQKNSFIGYVVGYKNTSGSYNSFTGFYSGYYNTSGKENTFIGESAGFRNGTGHHNTFIGRGAGYDNALGSANTYIGWKTGYGATGSNNVFIGSFAGGNETGSHKLYIDNTDTSEPLIEGDFLTNKLDINGDLCVGILGQAYKYGGGPWEAISDKRLKQKVRSYEKGLTELLQVNPVSYHYNDLVVKPEYQKEYVGVIAQDIQKVAPSMVSEFELTNEKSNAKENYLAVDPNEFTYMLINAVKEQQSALEQKDAEVDELKERLSQLESLVQNALNTSGSTQRIKLDTSSELFQNQPNPFNETTRIKYALSPDTKNAVMQITDMSGKLLKTIQLDASTNGEVIIEAQELNAGTYIYSLIADGQILSTKKMLLTK